MPGAQTRSQAGRSTPLQPSSPQQLCAPQASLHVHVGFMMQVLCVVECSSVPVSIEPVHAESAASSRRPDQLVPHDGLARSTDWTVWCWSQLALSGGSSKGSHPGSHVLYAHLIIEGGHGPRLGRQGRQATGVRPPGQACTCSHGACWVGHVIGGHGSRGLQGWPQGVAVSPRQTLC